MNGLSLCSGIGGLDLGLHLAIPDYRTICYVEIEAYPQDVLLARMADGVLDRAPIWGDLEQFDARPWRGLVDLVHGGYPCQPFSGASRGRRVAIDLWPEFQRVIGECQPAHVFLENVNQSAFRTVRQDLKSLGYRVAGPTPFTSSELGAPFVRRGYSYLPSLTATANYASPSMQKWPSCRTATRILGKPSPPIWEWLHGTPIGWTDLKPLATESYREWLRSHGEH